jgi:hypothetical protein
VSGNAINSVDLASADVAPLFTNFKSANTGLPRNLAIPHYCESKPDQYAYTPNSLGFKFFDLGVGATLRGRITRIHRRYFHALQSPAFQATSSELLNHGTVRRLVRTRTSSDSVSPESGNFVSCPSASDSHVSLRTTPEIAQLPIPQFGSRCKCRFQRPAEARLFSPQLLPEIPCVRSLHVFVIVPLRR